MSVQIVFDPVTIATLIVAIATFVLAFFTYLLYRESSHQLNILKRQTTILRSQTDPILIVKSFSFNLNKLIIRIENIGNGPTSSQAIGTSFALLKKGFYKSDNTEVPLNDKEIIHLLSQGKKLTYYYDLLDERAQKITPFSLACFLKDQSQPNLLFLPNKTYTYSLDLKFGLGNENDFTYESFESLSKILKENGIKYFVIKLELLYKNIVENRMPSQVFAFFVVDLELHNSLNDAFIAKITPHYYTIGYEALAETGTPIGKDFYLNSKSEEISEEKI